MAFDYFKYLRKYTLPHIWCSACGHGIVLKSLIRAMTTLNLDKDKTVIASGIGCASRLPGYMDCNTLHTTHGRALAFSTGLKLARPELTVIVVAGDGDTAAIGGNHFIHACRRNLDMTLIIFNNYIYGMTGGQYSPAMPEWHYASTTPYGNPDPQFDLCKLAIGSGAIYVAREVSLNSRAVEARIKEAITHKGFSVVEVMDECYTAYGRRNKFKSAMEMMKKRKEQAVPVTKAATMSPQELEGRLITGVLHKVERGEYWDAYQKVQARAQEKKE